MKDEQGTNIVNPETMKIIRNLRGKATHEGKDKDFYVNSFLADNVIRMQTEGLSAMAAMEKYGQKWCLERGIVGYGNIASVIVRSKEL